MKNQDEETYAGEINKELDDHRDVDLAQRRRYGSSLDRLDSRQESSFELLLIAESNRSVIREKDVQNLAKTSVVLRQRMEQENDQLRDTKIIIYNSNFGDAFISRNLLATKSLKIRS